MKLKVLFGLLILSAAAFSQTAFTYQGQLKSGGSPANGSYNLTFSLWDSASGGSQVGLTQSVSGASASNGLFTVKIDFGNAAFTGPQRWIEITVNGTTLMPRQEVTAAPYSTFSQAPWVTSGSAISYNNGFVGVGRNTPINSTEKFGILANIDHSFGGMYVETTGGNGLPYYGMSTPLGYSYNWLDGDDGFKWKLLTGSILKSDVLTFTPTGLFGVGTFNPAMSIEAQSPSYYGAPAIGGVNGGGWLYMNVSSADHSIIWNSNSALRFGTETNKGSGYTELMRVTSDGRVGINTANPLGKLHIKSAGGNTVYVENPTGYGIRSISQSSVGISGQSDTSNGVSGSSLSSSGVEGVNNSATPNGSAGVYGVGFGNNGVGVSGAADVGIYAYGIYGTSSFGYAGLFNGKVTIYGALAKSSGTFLIDHPLDPANKYLSHSFVESPDMKNIYDGIITTDENGYAVVTMPTWFDALNKDFRYQLTILDDVNSNDFVQAKIVKKMQNRQFTIRTSKPRVEISWQVTGIRQDAWANAHRVLVEEDKPAFEKGFYIHPELFGQPESLSIVHAKELMKGDK